MEMSIFRGRQRIEYERRIRFLLNISIITIVKRRKFRRKFFFRFSGEKEKSIGSKDALLLC